MSIEHDDQWIITLSNHGGPGKESLMFPLDVVEDVCKGYAEHMMAKQNARIAELEQSNRMLTAERDGWLKYIEMLIMEKRLLLENVETGFDLQQLAQEHD